MTPTHSGGRSALLRRHHRRLRLEPLEDRRLLDGGTLFVDIDAQGAGTGESWTDAYIDLQSALTASATRNADADPANDIAEIWIAEGVYKPTKPVGTSSGVRRSTFSLVSGVSLIGGFAGSETSVDQRVTADGQFLSETILSGDIRTVGETSDNAYTVVYADLKTGTETTLDGLVITEGNSNNDDASSGNFESSGGGLYFTGSGLLTVINTIFRANSGYFGAGIFNYHATLTVINTRFDENVSNFLGGGIFNQGTSTVTGAAFVGNSAPHAGGGIYNQETLTITNSTFLANEANDGGGVYDSWGGLTITGSTFRENIGYVYGGGLSNHNGELDITESTFVENTASQYGGAIYNSCPHSRRIFTLTNSILSGNWTEDYGGGIYNDDGMMIVIDSTFTDNSARWGGGIDNNTDGSLVVTNSNFSGNSASYGGGIYNGYECTLTVTNSVFSGNTVSGSGGGIINDYKGVTTVTNSTLSGNSAELGGGIYSSQQSLSTTLNNGILWNNSAGENSGNFYFSGGTVVLNDTLAALSDGTAGIYGDWIDNGGNLLGNDPLFVDAVGGDFRLCFNSPAVDAGDNTLLPPDEQDMDGDGDTTEPIPIDLDGLPRVYRRIVDLGAYENQFSNLFVDSVTPQRFLDPNDPAIDLVFSDRLDETIDYTPFVAVADPDAAAVTLTVRQTAADTLRIELPTLAREGRYTIRVSSELVDQDGDWMNQDRDSLGGEPEEDGFDHEFLFYHRPWQNPLGPLDVDDDTHIAPIDALLIINELNRSAARELFVSELPSSGSYSFYDTNGDGHIAPIDALLVINYLNSHPAGPAPLYAFLQAEGESPTFGKRLAEVTDLLLIDLVIGGANNGGWRPVPAGLQPGLPPTWI